MIHNKYTPRVITGKTVLLAGCSLLVGVPQLMAQEAVDAHRSSLEEIVVTSQKRAESLQDVPFSVSAVTGLNMEKFHIQDFKDLTGTVPNVHFTQISNVSLTAALTIRGIGIATQPDPFAGTEVAVVIDGVIQGTRLLGLTDQFDLERVEVLRGPQGTLFGANTLGGVINVVSRQPTGEFGVYGKLTLGNYNEVDGAVAVNFPIVKDKLAGKVSVSHRTRDGFFTNLADGQDLMWVNTTKARAYLKWTPTATFDATLTGEYDRIRNGADTPPNTSVPGQLLYRSPGWQGFVFKTYSDATRPNNANLYSVTLTANWDSPIGELTSISNYSEFNAINVQDVDGTEEFLLNAGRELGSWQYSQEIRTVFHPSNSLEVLIGAFYMKLDHKVNTLTQPQGLAPGILTEQFVHGNEDHAAAFTQGYWNITDELRLGAGVRFSWEKTDFFTNNISRFLANPDPTRFRHNIALATVLGSFEANGNKSWTNLSGKIGLDYRIKPDVMLYGYYARGYKSGGFNGRITNPLFVGPYNGEFVDSFEVGIRSDWLDKRLRVNLSAFYNDWSDMQVNQSIFIGSVSSSTILNAAAATTKGIEAEVEVIPVDGLRLNGTLGYLEAKYDKFSNAGTDYAGRSTPHAPKWTASARATYEINEGPGVTTASVLYTYVDHRWGNFTQSPLEYLAPVSLVHANLTWEPDNRNWSISLWVRNLFDKKYKTAALDPGAFAFASYGAPRQYGVDFGFNF